MNKKILLSVGIIIILAIAYWLISPLWMNVVLNEPLPINPSSSGDSSLMIKENDEMPSNAILSRGNMIARAHEVSGEALLVQDGGAMYLRFENLKTINGPDLRIYLSADLNANDFVDLGPIRATEGSVNYPIPVGTDIHKYKNAMIWCRAFSVLFSYAQL